MRSQHQATLACVPDYMIDIPRGGAKPPCNDVAAASESEPDAFGGENVNPNRIAAAVSAVLGEQPAARKGGVSRIPGARSRAGSRHASPRSRHASPMR